MTELRYLGVDNTSQEVVEKTADVQDYSAILQNYFNESLSSAHASGGTITLTGGITFSIAAGVGYINTSGVAQRITWNTLTGSTLFNGDNYIGIDDTGNVTIASSPFDSQAIPLGYISTGLSNTVILGYSNTRFTLKDHLLHLTQWLRRVQGSHVEYGVNTAMQAAPNTLKLTVGSGVIWALLNHFDISDTSTFTKLINTSNLGFIPDTVTTGNEINTAYWNNTANPHTTALVPLTTGYYKKDLVCVTPEGSVFVVYGDTEYATLEEAKTGSIPKVPANLTLSIVRSASIISQQGATSVAEVKDIRPIPSRLFETGVVSSIANVVSHSDLIDLNVDSHPQYHTDARGDIRYYLKSQVDTLLSGKSATGHTHVKAEVGLANVDNTADLNKPISNATQTALNTKLTTPTVNGLAVSTGAGNGATVGRTLTGTTNRISVSNGDGTTGDPTIDIPANPVLQGTASLTIPFGTTAQRDTPTNGKVRYNTTTALEEVAKGGVYKPFGKLLQVVTGNISQVTGTTTIPYDASIPLNTEGFQIFTASITPTYSNSLILVMANIFCESSIAGAILTLALFNGTTCISANVGYTDTVTANSPISLALSKQFTSGVTTPLTISARVGGSAASTIYVNRGNTETLGSVTSSFILMEVLP